MFTSVRPYSVRLLRHTSAFHPINSSKADVLPSHIDFDGFGTVFYKSLRFFRLNSTLLILISGKMLEIPNTLDVGKSLSFKSDKGQVYVYFRHF